MSVTDEGDVVESGSHRSDVQLIAAVRAGEMAAYGELWRRHETAARRFAASIARPGDVEELVSESFYRVLRAINGGGGPNAAFRAYLFQAMRNANVDVGRAYLNRVVLTDEERVLDIEQSASAAEVSAEENERTAAVRAWASLPESSRMLLWHLIIEEETPAQIAPILGISPNGVSSRAVRAKERLRQAFLQQQLADAEDDACIQARSKFGALVRGALSESGRQQVENHLATCTRGCPEALLEISDINQTLRAVIAPLLLGGPIVAAKYIGTTGAVAAAAEASGGGWSVAARAVLRTNRLVVAGVGIGGAVLVTAFLLTHSLARRDEAVLSRGSLGATPTQAPTETPTKPKQPGTQPGRSGSTPAPAKSARATPATSGQKPTVAHIVTPPPLPGPSASAASSPRAVTVSVRSAEGSGSGTLTASLPAGWRLTGASPAPGGHCQYAAGVARCELPSPTPGWHRFGFTVLPPSSGTSATMNVSYQDASGIITQQQPL